MRNRPGMNMKKCVRGFSGKNTNNGAPDTSSRGIHQCTCRTPDVSPVTGRNRWQSRQLLPLARSVHSICSNTCPLKRSWATVSSSGHRVDWRIRVDSGLSGRRDIYTRHQTVFTNIIFSIRNKNTRETLLAKPVFTIFPLVTPSSTLMPDKLVAL